MCVECSEQRKDIAAQNPALAGAMPAPSYHADEPMLNTVAAPMREIPTAILMQDAANDRLSKAVEILHDRTSGLRHAVDRGEEPGKAMRDFGSETARNIADQANRTNMAAQVIEKILTEMEL